MWVEEQEDAYNEMFAPQQEDEDEKQ